MAQNDFSHFPGAGRVHEDLAAERAVLGAILTDNQLITDVARTVQPDDFSAAAHGDIFRAMLSLDNAGTRVDHVTLAESLKTLGKLAAVGGPAYLMTLDQEVPVTHNAGEYAGIVRDQAVRRRLANVGREIQELASSDTGELAALLDEAERKVFVIAEKKREGDLVPVSQLMARTLELMDKMKANTTGVTGTATGFIELDQLLTGLHGGELLILAARPGIGKTSLAMNMAMNIALGNSGQPGRAVGIFSLEMPADQLLMRLLSSQARVDMKRLRSGHVNNHDEEKLSHVANALYNAPLYIDDTGGLSPFDLRAKARRLKQKHSELGLLVIDYLQLMHQKGKVESRQLEIAEISRSLKQLSKELEVPILALSQLNRKVEERKDGAPMLSDLRESGAIEQDADVVMFIHREEKDEEGGGDGGGGGGGPAAPGQALRVQLVVAKQRNGPTGEVPLLFFGQYTRFENEAREGRYG